MNVENNKAVTQLVKVGKAYITYYLVTGIIGSILALVMLFTVIIPRMNQSQDSSTTRAQRTQNMVDYLESPEVREWLTFPESNHVPEGRGRAATQSSSSFEERSAENKANFEAQRQANQEWFEERSAERRANFEAQCQANQEWFDEQVRANQEWFNSQAGNP